MVKRWGTCNTDDRYPERLEGGVKFIPFPKPATNLEKCKWWIKLCGRPTYQLNEDLLRDRNKSKHFYVCTKHFVDGGPSEKYPDPKSALEHGRVTMSRPAPKKRQSPDCSDNTPEPKKLSVEVRVFENGQTEVQQTQEDSTVVPTDNSVMSEDCQPGKESVESNDINSLDVLAMAAEKRKLEEVIISLREENNKLKCEQMHLQDSLAISRV